MMPDYSELLKMAYDAKQFSYAPYSSFHVGAALLAANGSVYTGCNIENAAYSPTNCAERTAFFKAVSEGVTQFQAIAIAGDSNSYLYPCGVCRQVMQEFCDENAFEIIVSRDPENYKIYKLAELFPGSFSKNDIGD